MLSRRLFLASLAGGTALAADPKRLHVSTNVYPWYTFYGREKRDFHKDLDASLAEVADAGLDGFEPIINTPADVKALLPRIKKAGLQMRSLYMNAKLHEAAGDVIKNAVAVAEAAKPAGLHWMVVNPTPLKWGGADDKSDEQLEAQAKNLGLLGKKLREAGVVLAYHNHDAEMRRSAREYHHMMNGTDPADVSLCLDAHWVYRGAGDSRVALFDVCKLYLSRIAVLHLRQSSRGVWTEAFGPGDIDYGRLVGMLVAKKLKPHVVLEQAVEAKSPREMNAKDAHAAGTRHVRKTMAALA